MVQILPLSLFFVLFAVKIILINHEKRNIH